MRLTGVLPAVFCALGAAALFGASTPFAKPLAGALPATLLAGLLYTGSGVGLLLIRLGRDRGWSNPGLARREWRWLFEAIGFGGVLGPLFLMAGLARTAAGTTSLLLNLEAVFTAVLAWLAFRENADRRIVLGMALIVAGATVLAWPGDEVGGADWPGVLAIAAACLCWAIDNNLTRRVSGADALFLAGSKGLVAGCVNLALALALGAAMPSWGEIAAALLIGFLGYGMSLVLFVLALRGLGTARTGAYFSTAPFVGAAVSILFLGEPTSAAFWLAAALMAIGVWLHLTERHLHPHTHEEMLHTHGHVHDEHHRHEHDFPWDGSEPHSHPHRHTPMTHTHAHYPDLHHRHPHG